ncbi:MAG TPA: glycosyltransferase family 4 protein [Acidimicrobiales bacterium]|nr:glycosyltransferase family 4 protein [Acidimicrobiales bacterium]
MRIALVCPYSLSQPGGVQGQVLGLARALEAIGLDTLVLAPADGPVGDMASHVVALGRSLPVPANGSVAPISLGPVGAGRAVRRIRGAGVDVVHLHEPLAPGAGYACLVACPQPKVGTFHRAGASAAYRLLGPVARWAARHLDVRCAVSPEAMTTAREALGGRYEVVGNGVELDRFAAAEPWPTRGPTVLFVGRHERRKGLGILLEAFGRDDGPGATATLWVVGHGPETDALRARLPAGARVEWLGRVGDDELASRLRGAHVLCAPSLGGESFGMVLLEAMAARTAVVASDIPGYRFVAGRHARLVTPGDAVALARALARSVDDVTASAGASAPAALDSAFAHASTWSMARLAERYTGIYEAALSSRQPAG